MGSLCCYTETSHFTLSWLPQWDEHLLLIIMSSDQEACYLCKEYLRDPVSIPCGHTFCSICLKTYWDHTDHTGSYMCPECRVTYNKRPTPRRATSSRYSTMPRNSESFPPPPPSPDYNYAGPQDVGCDICVGKKYKAIKTCLMCLASYCEKHLKPHFESATFKRHKLVDEIGHLDRQIDLSPASERSGAVLPHRRNVYLCAVYGEGAQRS